MSAAPLRVLCVCTGNICRSPVAHLLLQDALGDAVEVTSAGTHALVGAPLAPPMAALLAHRGAVDPGLRGRQVQVPQLRAADLVLVMTLEQRSLVVDLCPAVVRRTFTLRELARLLDLVEPGALAGGPTEERVRRAVTLAAAQRAFQARPEDDDIADPHRRGDAAHEVAFDQIVDAVDRIGAALRVPGYSISG